MKNLSGDNTKVLYFVVNKNRKCINGQKYHSIFGKIQHLNHFYMQTSLRASVSSFHGRYLSISYMHINHFLNRLYSNTANDHNLKFADSVNILTSLTS